MSTFPRKDRKSIPNVSGLLYTSGYESRTTKPSELIFSALLDNDGARNVHFERAL
jgi:hypothetical protein